MAQSNKAASKGAAPKKVYYIQKNKDGKEVAKFELLGKRFFYQGEKYTAEKAAENQELMEKLIANKAPAIIKV